MGSLWLAMGPYSVTMNRMASRKLFKCLLGPPEAAFHPKTTNSNTHRKGKITKKIADSGKDFTNFEDKQPVYDNRYQNLPELPQKIDPISVAQPQKPEHFLFEPKPQKSRAN